MAYANGLRDLLENPGSFQGSPGFGFARDQALQATSRRMSGMRNSGNILSALQRQASGLASQDYGNQVDRMQRAAGMEQDGSQFDRRLGLDAEVSRGRLGVDQEQNRLTGQRDANAFTLGQGQNANTAQRNRWDYDLGVSGQDQQRRQGDQQFGLGMYRAGNEYSLGSQQNQNTANRNWWDYQNGRDQGDVNRYDAQTRRGSARSNDWWR